LGRAGNDISSIIGLANLVCFVVLTASQAFLPDDTSGGIESDNPYICTIVFAGYVSIRRAGSSGNNVSSVGSLPDAFSCISTGASQAFLPQDRTTRVQPDYPEIAPAMGCRYITVC
jgi:hypothetical protein